MAIVMLSGAGHIRLPQSVKEKLGLAAGDKIEMRMVEGGFVVLTKELVKPQVSDIEHPTEKPNVRPSYVWVRTGHFEDDPQPRNRVEPGYRGGLQGYRNNYLENDEY